jgi:MFS transporter, DHA2 family, multidrug resistance protein
MSEAPSLGNLSPGALKLSAFAVALATFMMVLDTTIANVTLPVVAGNLGVSADQGTWMITSFAVANAVTVPLTGWLMRRFGLVRTFVTAIALFTAASFLCGIAWNLSSLITFRVLQGAVSGPMYPGSQALLLAVFGPKKRGTALGLWSITGLVAPVIGPLMGGYIADQYSWPWIFLINVPIGIISAVMCWRLLGVRDTPTQRVPVDRVGLGLLIVWVGALQIMLDKGKDSDWFASPLIVALAVIAVVVFVVFLVWELTEAHPIVDLALFRSLNFALGTIAMCIGFSIFIANLLLMTLWLQTQLNYTATWAGLVLMPSGIVAVLLTPFIGRYIGRVDARWFATIAMLSLGVSYLMRARLNTTASVADFMWPLLVQGIGMATFFVAFLAIILNGIVPDRVPAASGLSLFARSCAGSFATAMVTTFWDRRAALHQSQLAEHTSAFDQPMRAALTQLQGIGLSGSESLAALGRTLGVQAYANSALDLFWISGWLAFAVIGLVWLTHSTVRHGKA